MNHRAALLTLTLIALAPLACAGNDHLRPGNRWVEVNGNGVHEFSTAVIHSVTETEVGFIQESTETVNLTGDLSGRLLYHPVSVFDFASGTLVNSGHQVFSGTVLGKGPVLLHDDEYRFEVNLGTGQTTGEVFLENRLAGPNIRCHLDVSGSGEIDESGDALFSYTGACRIRQSPENPRRRGRAAP